MKFKKPKISKKKIVIFSVFVIVATIFWFLNALNKEYTTKIEYPAEFYNFPKSISSSVSVPDKLTVSVKAYGFDILRKLNISKPIKINVNKYAVKDKSDKSKIIINTSKLSDELFPGLTNIEIISIKPETIIFTTNKILSKKVPVKLNIDFSCKPLYMKSGAVKAVPDSIMIYGSGKNISKINSVETAKINFKDLDDTLESKVLLTKIKNINFSEENINIIIPVEKYTESTSLIPIKVINCPDSLKVITFPKEIKITYKVTLSRYNSISKDNFVLTADYAEIDSNKAEKLKLVLSKYPKDIGTVKFSPEYVEYIIEKTE